MMYPKNSWGLLPNCMDIQYPPKVLDACMYVGFSTKHNHSVWKSEKKSHSTMRAKRATFTFWVDKSSLKMPKMVNLTSFCRWYFLADFQTLWGSECKSDTGHPKCLLVSGYCPILVTTSGGGKCQLCIEEMSWSGLWNPFQRWLLGGLRPISFLMQQYSKATHIWCPVGQDWRRWSLRRWSPRNNSFPWRFAPGSAALNSGCP